jgi:hypothetical protein
VQKDQGLEGQTLQPALGVANAASIGSVGAAIDAMAPITTAVASPGVGTVLRTL